MAMHKDKQESRGLLYSLLGDLPERGRPISAELLNKKDCGGYILETLLLDLNGIEPVPAYVAKPKNAHGKLPCVVFNHYHGGQYRLGKDELILNGTFSSHEPYAQTLTGLGYIAACIDVWNFGDRSGRTEDELFKEMLWNGRVLWGMMMYDYLRSVDWLVSRSDVDESRLAAMGLSLGSTASWWLAALDERIALTVDLCCATDFDELIRTRGLDEHGIYYYVPSLLKHFSASDIMALIAPRKRLSLNGRYDKLTPIEGLYKIDKDMKEEYARCGVPNNWRMVIDDCGHMETAHMRSEIVKFLRENL
ncbi:MAG: acetylxylan esterase [Oscillospiraceae bacterium]|nr:acetylxylan esterase [Oscillospiraceae bacterium]